MAFIGVDDGSSVELMSTVEPGLPSPIWNEAIAGGAGPCGWAVRAQDVGVEAERLRRLGVEVEGPSQMSRETPEGQIAEWEMASTGGSVPGRTIPFLIRDLTPRSTRVSPSSSVGGSELTGIESVVLGVDDAIDWIERLCAIYELGAPEERGQKDGWPPLRAFRDAPIVLAGAPASGWLVSRLDRYGELPCGLLIGSRDLAATTCVLTSATIPSIGASRPSSAVRRLISADDSFIDRSETSTRSGSPRRSASVSFTPGLMSRSSKR